MSEYEELAVRCMELSCERIGEEAQTLKYASIAIVTLGRRVQELEEEKERLSDDGK